MRQQLVSLKGHSTDTPINLGDIQTTNLKKYKSENVKIDAAEVEFC